MTTSSTQFFGALKRSSFLKHNAVFFFGSVAVGALNYLYYPILGRLMSPAEFGEVQVVVTLFLQFTIFLNVLSVITVTISVNYKNTKKAHRIMFELEKLASYCVLGLLAFSLLGGEFLRQQLKFDSQLPFVALALAMLVSIPLTFRSAYARGQKHFGVASLSQLIGAGVKVLFSAALIVLGLGVSGAIFGIVAAQLLAFLYAARWAYRLGFRRPSDTNYGTLPDLKLVLPELTYASAAFVTLITLTLMMSIDVIVAKYYFDAHMAGLYAGIATVGRIVFFLAAPIAQVLMPHIKASQPEQKNRQLLLRSLGLTIAATGSVVVACTLFPQDITRLLMGVDYITYAYLLPELTLAICIISIINITCMYYLALRKKTIMVVGIIGFAATLILMTIWHADLQALVHCMLTGSILTLSATGTYVLATLKRGSRHAKQNDLDRDTDLQ